MPHGRAKPFLLFLLFLREHKKQDFCEKQINKSKCKKNFLNTSH